MNKTASITLIALAVVVLAGTALYQKTKKIQTLAPAENKQTQNPTPQTQYYSSSNLQITSPAINAQITSPVTITGQAVGNWFFEASFPVKVTDSNNIVIGSGVAKTTANWMTTNFVPFTATITFTTPGTATGFIVLEKDNPSGEPVNAASESFPITF